jgi:hypothetical protein
MAVSSFSRISTEEDAKNGQSRATETWKKERKKVVNEREDIEEIEEPPGNIRKRKGKRGKNIQHNRRFEKKKAKGGTREKWNGITMTIQQSRLPKPPPSPRNLSILNSRFIRNSPLRLINANLRIVPHRHPTTPPSSSILHLSPSKSLP